MKTRVITVKGPFLGNQYSASSVHQDIVLQGIEGQEIEATITVQEASDGDVQCRIEHDAIECDSQSSEEFSIEEIAVKIPKKTSLRIQSVSGDLRVEGFSESSEIHLRSVSGDVGMRDCQGIKTFKGHSVSGDISLGRCKGQKASFKTVSGDVELDHCQLDELQFDTVSGDLEKSESTIGKQASTNVKNLGHEIARSVKEAVQISIKRKSKE